MKRLLFLFCVLMTGVIILATSSFADVGTGTSTSTSERWATAYYLTEGDPVNNGGGKL